MNYFITGATGFIGSRLANQLVEAGHSVTALVRNPAAAAALQRSGVRLVQGDLSDRDSLRNGMSGADGLFHLAAWYKVGAKDRGRAYEINVEGTRNVLEIMSELKIRKGVYTSTLAVFSDTRRRLVDESYYHEDGHLSEYDRTKWLAHYRVAEPMMANGLPLVIVQPGLVYGPGDPSAIGRLLRDYLDRKLPGIPRRTAFCWAHVDDVARGHILAMEKGRTGESYIIAGPPHSLESALKMAERLTGVPAPKMRFSPGLLKLMSKLMRPVEAAVPLPENYRSETLRVSAGVTYLGDNAKARDELGYEPRPLESGLAETLKAMSSERR